MKNRIFDESMCQNCSKFTTKHQSLNVFNLLAATKNLITNYTFFIAHGAGIYHIETSPFNCRANQLTGYFMIETSVMKELNQHDFINSRNKKAMKNF